MTTTQSTSTVTDLLNQMFNTIPNKDTNTMNTTRPLGFSIPEAADAIGIHVEDLLFILKTEKWGYFSNDGLFFFYQKKRETSYLTGDAYLCPDCDEVVYGPDLISGKGLVHLTKSALLARSLGFNIQMKRH